MEDKSTRPEGTETPGEGNAEVRTPFEQAVDIARGQAGVAADALRRGEFVQETAIDPDANSDDRLIALLAYAVVRFNAKKNPNPKSFTHNSPLEIAWTLGPIVILVVIGAFSLPVLFKQQEIPEGDIVIKVTGYQWYWGYEYVGTDLAYDGYLIGSPATGGDNRLTDEVEAQLVEAGYAAPPRYIKWR